LENGGPLNVAYPTFAQPFSGYMQGALNELGMPTVPGFNNGSLMGCSYCSTTINPTTGRRDSAATSFLNDAKRKGRTNIHVFTSTMAKKIVLDEKKRAVGVIVEKRGKERTLGVKKEVIVSAGAFQSPQLLMVSGIGPADHLRELDIPVLVDLPGVGQNLQDHIFFGPTYKVDVRTFTSLTNVS
jgi:choline dehydrogenase